MGSISTLIYTSELILCFTISELPLVSFSMRVLVPILSYENEFHLQVNEISFSYERMGTKTRIEKETKGNSEMVKQRINSEISFTCKLNSFSYEWFCTKTRFEKEAKGNSEMAYLSQQHATCRNTSQQGGQTHTTCCAQQCCDMLRWHVAIVWPGLKRIKRHGNAGKQQHI